jgi:hypothetical protein
VRVRLTLLYGGLFLLSGAALMAITYALLVNAGFVFTLQNGISTQPLTGQASLAQGVPAAFRAPARRRTRPPRRWRTGAMLRSACASTACPVPRPCDLGPAQVLRHRRGERSRRSDLCDHGHDHAVTGVHAGGERVLASEQDLEQVIDGLLALTRGQAGLERRELLDLATLSSQALLARESEFAGLDLDVRAKLATTWWRDAPRRPRSRSRTVLTPRMFATSGDPARALLEHQQAVSTLHATLLLPLETYDSLNATDLVATLDAFLSACGHWSVGAAKLGIHVNTLRYRLARIEKHTGRDLDSMADLSIDDCFRP